MRLKSACVDLKAGVIVIFIFISILGQTESSSDKQQQQYRHHNHHYRTHHIQSIIRESYSEVSAYVAVHFNDKCKLALHNCLFRTEWEKVFDGGSGGGEHASSSSATAATNSNDRSSRNENEDQESVVYFYCQPFLIARFCVDDYMRRSGSDEWESALNLRCLNGTDGNSPLSHFKNAIYRDKCKSFYGYYFDAYNHAPRTLHVPTTNRLVVLFLTIVLFHFGFYSDFLQ